jgi:hypothetical protein
MKCVIPSVVEESLELLLVLGCVSLDLLRSLGMNIELK